MGAHPRSLEIEWHLLEVIFHLPAIALEILVKWRRLQSPGALRWVARKAFSGEVGDDEARVVALRRRVAGSNTRRSSREEIGLPDRHGEFIAGVEIEHPLGGVAR